MEEPSNAFNFTNFQTDEWIDEQMEHHWQTPKLKFSRGNGVRCKKKLRGYELMKKTRLPHTLFINS